MTLELVMYSRTTPCPFVSMARRMLDEHSVPYREIHIDRDRTARERLLDWTGFLAVPTLIVAQTGETLPVEVPPPLEKGSSPRGINRGAMITEPNTSQLEDWLRQHDLIKDD